MFRVRQRTKKTSMTEELGCFSSSVDREHPGFGIVGGKFESSKGKKTSPEDVGNTTNIGTSAQIETYSLDVTFGHRSNHPSGMSAHLARKFVLLLRVENKNLSVCWTSLQKHSQHTERTLIQETQGRQNILLGSLPHRSKEVRKELRPKINILSR